MHSCRCDHICVCMYPKYRVALNTFFYLGIVQFWALILVSFVHEPSHIALKLQLLQ